MGVYGRQVLPRIIDVACRGSVRDGLRRRVCAVEPSEVAWRLAARRLAAARGCAAGSAGSTRCSSGSSAAATSPGRSPDY